MISPDRLYSMTVVDFKAGEKFQLYVSNPAEVACHGRPVSYLTVMTPGTQQQ